MGSSISSQNARRAVFRTIVPGHYYEVRKTLPENGVQLLTEERFPVEC